MLCLPTMRKAKIVDYIQCPKCETHANTDALFCSRCGTALTAQSVPVQTVPAEGQTQRLETSAPAIAHMPMYAPPMVQPQQVAPTPYQSIPQPLYQQGMVQQPMYQPMPQHTYAPMPSQPYYPAPVQQVNVVMTQQAAVAAVSETPVTAVVVINKKSVAAAFLLTLLFGPLGMFYSTVRGALIMLIVSIFLATATAGASLPLTWLVCMIWGCSAARNPTS